MGPAARVGLVAALVLASGCGKKGAPLAPLHLVPAQPGDVKVSRVGPEAHVRFVVPARNLNGAGPSVLDHIEIYAMTVAPGAPPPANRDLLTPKFLVGTMAIKPPPVEGEPEPAPAPDAAPDTRPSGGDTATFVEALTPETLEPVTLATKVLPAPPPAATPAADAPAAPVATYPARHYAARGVTKKGRPGQVSARVQLPIVAPPAAPAGPAATATEKAVVVTWTAPAANPVPTFNVYKVGGAAPLTTQPIAAPTYERPGVTWGTEECFTVRAVETVATVSIESEPSAPACVTPRDTFPPAAPKGLSVVAGPGTINLSWDAGNAADLAGYLVLRGEAPGDTLQPLTPAPIAGTNFEDKTVTAGVRYAYAIVAVDKAVPPNRSAPSARVEETAR